MDNYIAVQQGESLLGVDVVERLLFLLMWERSLPPGVLRRSHRIIAILHAGFCSASFIETSVRPVSNINVFWIQICNIS